MTDPRPQPGERQPASPKRLDRAPGERYRARPEADTGDTRIAGSRAGPLIRSLGAAILVATAGGLGVFLLGMFDIGAGLIAVTAAIGWAVALAIVWGGGARSFRTPATRALVAAAIAAGAVVAGFLLNWAWSRIEGGVLGPVAYLDERYGLLAMVDVAAAMVAATLRAR